MCPPQWVFVPSLTLHLCGQAGSRAAVAEARAWQHNAAAWSERLAAAFPLYADLMQPLALAVLEASAGLGLLADAAEGLASGSGAGEGGAAAAAVVAQLLAFPALAQGAAGVALVVPLTFVLLERNFGVNAARNLSPLGLLG